MSNLNERPATGNSNIALWVLVPFVMGVLADVVTNHYLELPNEPLGMGFAGIQMALGVLPNLVAAYRKHHQKKAIFALTIVHSELLDALNHFGHLERQWHPIKNGISRLAEICNQ